MFHTEFDRNKKLWSGYSIPPLYNPNISIGQVMLRALKVNGTRLAQISDNANIHMTFEEIRIKTIRAAQNLQKLGYYRHPKDVFAFMAKNSHHLAPVVFASFCLGCPINTLDPSFGKTEIIHMLKTTQPKLVCCDATAYELVAECLRELKNDAKIFTLGGKVGDSVPVEDLFVETGTEESFIAANVDGLNDIAAIVCSSGTTGLSKGVCLSHAVLIEQVIKLRITGDGVILGFSSLYWLSGLMLLIGGTLIGATRLMTTESYSPELFFRLIEQYRVTYTFTATYQMVLALKHEAISKTNLSSIRSYLVGGSKVPLGVVIEMNSYLPNGEVNVGYGMSEVSGVVSVNSPFIARDTVGKLIDGCRVKIIDENGKRLGVGEDGEVCIKFNYKFLGYYGNKQSSDEVVDCEGFILSGDIGHFDEDGYLYLIDRKKDLIKYRNFQISPSEIEGYLLDCPEVQSACVVGVPDEVAGDLPAAVIVRSENSTISEQKIYDMVSEHFADYNKLRGGVFFIDSMPTTPSGKIIRRRVKELAIKCI